MLTDADGSPVEIANRDGGSPVVLVCEHASNRLPQALGDLGLGDVFLQSHNAWDPGAFAVAQSLSSHLDSPLVSSRFSRLAYDVNRPPESPEAIRNTSEGQLVPGNSGMPDSQRLRRISGLYEPFHNALAKLLDNRADATSVLITVHSFTPVYFGQSRETELGILHDDDTRLADALLDLAPSHTRLKASRNEPYGPGDGVTHTLRKHALPRGCLNAMLEIRSDLIATAQQQKTIAREISSLIENALTQMEKSDAA